MVRLSTRTSKRGIIYAVSLGFRLSCWVLTLFLFWGLALNVSEGVSLTSMIHIVFLFLFALMGALFRDTWVFDVQTRTIYSFYGFGWIGKKEQFAFSEVNRLEVSHFVRGSINKDAKPTKRRLKAMVVFSLRLQDDGVRDIEIIPEKTSGGRTEAAVAAISAVTALSLFVDRPRDFDVQVGLRDL